MFSTLLQPSLSPRQHLGRQSRALKKPSQRYLALSITASSILLTFSFSPSLSPLLASTEPWLQPALHLPAASAALTEGNAAPNWHADRFPSSNTAARRLSAEKEEEEEEEEEEGEGEGR